MNLEIARQWAERLRSGAIQQTGGGLGYTDGSRCCLGVVCDMAVEAGIIEAPTVQNGRLAYGKNPALDVLPYEVIVWTGLDTPNGYYRNPIGSGHTLSEQNDIGMPFSEIADTIEKYASKL